MSLRLLFATLLCFAAAQATLLRVLETRSFRRVGGEKEMTVEVRVVGRHQQSAGGSG